MLKVEHIGIAVKDMAISVPLFEKLLNSQCYKQEIVEVENVKTAFIQSGETKIELLESTIENGVISKFIEKKGEGIHHIAFEVEDIKAEMDRLKNEGFILLNEEPKVGADNKLVCFLHPKNTNGVLIELCMERNDYPIKIITDRQLHQSRCIFYIEFSEHIFPVRIYRCYFLKKVFQEFPGSSFLQKLIPILVFLFW